MAKRRQKPKVVAKRTTSTVDQDDHDDQVCRLLLADPEDLPELLPGVSRTALEEAFVDVLSQKQKAYYLLREVAIDMSDLQSVSERAYERLSEWFEMPILSDLKRD